ncbi:MAG: nucleotidyltransferase [Bacteroidales bacterium]|jgi:UTP-glucose-1-phosphate uridylyltransferase|nr:nucleotidyltransferase [Bacteroidales bacterium]
MNPTLLILAAGMGSRFGGLKQVEPVGLSGEAIIDYSIYDAIRAGFGKVVFVIRKSFAKTFQEKFDAKLKGKIDVKYVFQELDNLPEGFALPEKRTKPWGTAHAILVARNIINEPFCVINADDFYGLNAYKVIADFLKNSSDKPDLFSMVGYYLQNTLSDFGSVSRGICSIGQYNNLIKIVEAKKIIKKENKIISIEENGRETLFTGNEIVSMNMWGFKPSIFETLNKKFTEFLKTEIHKLETEMYIPSVVFNMIQEKTITAKVLEARSSWFGITYPEDKPIVVEKIRSLITNGEYPEQLF